MLILASNSVFSISRAELISAIFAFSTRLGIPPWTTSLSRTIPLISLVSDRDPPAFFLYFDVIKVYSETISIWSLFGDLKNSIDYNPCYLVRLS